MSKKSKDLTRRDFLKTSGIATGTLIGGGLLGGLVGYNMQEKKPEVSKGEKVDTSLLSPKGRKFFTKNISFNTLAQATERIFPKDDLGPGAIELGVPYFIDNQLAGNYGTNEKEYMQGPFYPGKPTQGYQSPLTRAEVFTIGVAALEKEAKSRFDQSFEKLEGKQMDEVLTAFQKGEVQIEGVTSDFFFQLLRSATLDGVYADPIYNGNNNMAAWKMKNFPGHQFSYLNVIDNEEFQKIAPQSLASMDH